MESSNSGNDVTVKIDSIKSIEKVYFNEIDY